MRNCIHSSRSMWKWVRPYSTASSHDCSTVANARCLISRSWLLMGVEIQSPSRPPPSTPSPSRPWARIVCCGRNFFLFLACAIVARCEKCCICDCATFFVVLCFVIIRIKSVYSNSSMSANFSTSKQYVRPPQRGIFPLDHDADCRSNMEVRGGCEKRRTRERHKRDGSFYESQTILCFYCF